MKTISSSESAKIQGGKWATENQIHGCGMFAAAALIASSPLGPGALAVGLLTLGGCVLTLS